MLTQKNEREREREREREGERENRRERKSAVIKMLQSSQCAKKTKR